MKITIKNSINMENLNGPTIAALLAGITALAVPFVRSYLDKRKDDADVNVSEANAAMVLTGAYNNLLDKMQEQINAQGEKIEKQGQEIEKLSTRIKDLEDENLSWQREYRVIWDGAKRVARQVIELGEIPVFDPPENTFRGKLSYGDDDG